MLSPAQGCSARDRDVINGTAGRTSRGREGDVGRRRVRRLRNDSMAEARGVAEACARPLA